MEIKRIHLDLENMSLHDFALEVLRLINLRSNNHGIIDVKTVYGTNQLIVDYDPIKINREGLINGSTVLYEETIKDTSI